MMMPESLMLSGCKPTPLASYLKALGVLRLISLPTNNVTGHAADPNARGWWENECFHLRTALDPDSLVRFFLEDYAPSPIIAPWNGGSGFYPKDNRDGFDPLASGTVAERFEPIASAIQVASDAIKYSGLVESPKDAAKIKLVETLRAELPDRGLDWIDAALALSGETIGYPQLLGTGGNDGRLDFTNNFMRRLVSGTKPDGLFDAATGKPSPNARDILSSTLFDTSSLSLCSAPIGQFSPRAAGGPNATSGYRAHNQVNSWEFVLMLEGAVAFAGAATRRHQSESESGVSFPFTVRAVGAGWGGVETSDENAARAEFWAPLWSRPARYLEVSTLFAEGRAVLNGRTARDGLDFARAAASLGVSRGFSEFERYAFLKRAGDAYRAAPLGRRSAAPATGTILAADLDRGDWLDRVRRAGREKIESAAARHAIKRLEDALFGLVVPAAPPARMEEALVALGTVVDWLAVSRSGRKAVGMPPPMLSAAWVREADDGSAEFRIAAALAGLGLPAPESLESPVTESEVRPNGSDTTGIAEAKDGNSKKTTLAPPQVVPSMATHIAPIDEKRRSDGRHLPGRRAWADDGRPPSVVWGAGSLVSNMSAVLERRLVDGAMHGFDDKPLASAATARLGDVVAFLSGHFDDMRCDALLRGLVWARPARLPAGSRNGPAPASKLPFAYAALKPIFVPDEALRRIGALTGTARLPIPPGLVSRLRSGGGSVDGHATDDAVRAALARARASGLPSPFHHAQSGGREAASERSRFGVGIRADRLAAALLIPVDQRTLRDLLARAYPGALSDDGGQSDIQPLEETSNAA